MKKFYLLLALCTTCWLGFITSASATVFVVEVQDFSFSPANFTANTGDTIHWMWVDGSHTTTSTSIPTGASSWSAPLSSGSPDFDYVVTVAGEYDYVCTPHASMGMTGSFTVVDPTSVAELSEPVFYLGKAFVQDGFLLLEYYAPAEQVIIQMFDITGHRVYAEKPVPISAGLHRHSIPVGTLPSGIYIVNLMTNNDQRTRRVVID